MRYLLGTAVALAVLALIALARYSSRVAGTYHGEKLTFTPRRARVR